MPDKNDDQPKGTGGFFGGLKKLVFNEEALAAMENKNPTTTTVPQQNTTSVQPGINNMMPNVQADRSIEDKLMAMLQQINQPGCDFFEVMNAVGNMPGGVTPQNIQSAVIALQVADSTLNKSKILSTGEGYISALTEAMEQDAQKKANEKIGLQNQKSHESSSLQGEIDNLDDQIKQLQAQLELKRNQLTNINSKYDPQIVGIDTRVQQGNMALQTIVQKMQSVLQIVQTSNIK